MSFASRELSAYSLRRLFLIVSCILMPAAGLVSWMLGRRKAARAAFFASHALILYPTLKRNSRIWGPIATRFKTTKREVWLTLDDGPDPAVTPQILELLDAHQAKASFFCIGEKIEKYPDLCKMITERGHSVENHSYTHPATTFWSLTPRKMRAEIERTSSLIQSTTGTEPRYFRSPVGMTNPFVHPLLDKNHLLLVGWSSSGFDGVRTSPRAILKCLLPTIKPGAIILLHEGSRQKSAALQIHTLELLLQHLAQKRYRCVLPSYSDLTS